MGDRARTLGWVSRDSRTGRHNAITDVPGVRVGQAALAAGDKPMDREALARTGVTVIDLPATHRWRQRYFAGSHVANGFGQLTARDVIDTQGMLAGPIVLTGTRSVGAVYDAVLARSLDEDPDFTREDLPIPAVGECDDGYLNSPSAVCGRWTVGEAFEALSGGPVEEGGAGAGAGMHLFGYKGGIGTSSRQIAVGESTWTVGVLLLTNFGRPEDVRLPAHAQPAARPIGDPHPGSCIGIAVTDAPLHPQQLSRLAARIGFGLARTGSVGRSGSGEIALAVSTHTPIDSDAAFIQARFVADRPTTGPNAMDQLYGAIADATEEAVWNALLAGQTTSGHAGHRLIGFQDAVRPAGGFSG